MKLKIRYFSSHLELIDNNYPVYIYLVCIFSFNKSPILQELREDNTILIETKNMLEEQLSNCHKRVETVVELENELRKKRQMIEEMAHVCRLLEDVPKIHYYFHDTMTEICCFRAYLDIFFYTGERFRQREAENSNRRECTAAV